MYPNFPNKHRYESIIDPKRHLEYRKIQGKYPSYPPPEAVIFCYQSSFFDYVKATHPCHPCDGFLSRLQFLSETSDKIAIGEFGIGAPIAIARLEQLIAWGVKRFLSIGTAGSLQTNLHTGEIVVCERAIRDEGTSHHYLPPAKYAYPSMMMTDKICATLEKYRHPYRKGTSWTNDTIYRETAEEVEAYQKEGVLTVEMEASALFAVAEYRQVPLGALFTISDSLAHFEWHPEFHDERTQKGLEILYHIAVECLQN